MEFSEIVEKILGKAVHTEKMGAVWLCVGEIGKAKYEEVREKVAEFEIPLICSSISDGTKPSVRYIWTYYDAGISITFTKVYTDNPKSVFYSIKMKKKG